MAVLHEALPEEMRGQPGLPGVAPFEMGDWLRVDEVYAGQMALREVLLAARRAQVLWLDSGALGAAQELLEMVLARLPGLGFTGDQTRVCPDGRVVQVDRSDPLSTLGRLMQNDFCLMDKRGAEHVLVGAVLCFPASWTLAQKAGKPLGAIHAPVSEYDDGLARRVQRLFDGVQAGRPLWRFNSLLYATPELFTPRREGDPPRPRPAPGATGYRRAERQCILRLPQTRAVVFSIHTYVVAE